MPVFCWKYLSFQSAKLEKLALFFGALPPLKTSCLPAERQRGRRRKTMVFHGREPIKKCYAEFENYVSLGDTNFVKPRGKIVEKIEEKVEIFKALEYSKSC